MFQGFETAADHGASGARVERLRATLRDAGLDGLLVPRADEHQGEYIPPSAARLAWLTGFQGSAGVALVLLDRAFIFVDGRYTLQVRDQVDLAVFEPVDSTRTSVPDLLRRSREGLAIGFDPWLHTVSEAAALRKALEARGGRLVPLPGNPIDRLWNDRPAPPKGPVRLHPERFAGRGAAEKLDALRQALADEDADAAVLTDPASLAWALNIRGSDVPHTPLPLGFAILRRTGRPDVFLDPDKLDAATRRALEPLARIAEPAAFEAVLRGLGAARVMLDPALGAERIRAILTEAGAAVLDRPDPARLPRAVKNAGELAGARAAQVRDGAALATFLAWLDAAEPGTVTEIAAVERLEAVRSQMALAAGMALKDVSFDTIAGSGPNGAIVHYRVDRSSDRTLGAGELFLLDSGAQYEDGTTDVTRTVPVGAPTAEMRRAFTLVLKGMIAISAARFPAGTRGVDLDPLARIALWKAGADYAHGTGHGVGSYLAVHEGPQSISRRGMAMLAAGMILSNEPGYYRAGAFGIRIENLLVVEPASAIPGGDLPMHGFETLTLVPIDRRLIDVALMDPAERAWLDRYHERVQAAIGPLLEPGAQRWLGEATRPLEAEGPA